MSEISDRLEGKLDNIDDRLDSIDTRLAVYNEQLKVHIKRTTKIEEELNPIVKHVERVKGVIMFVSITATITSLIAFIMSL